MKARLTLLLALGALLVSSCTLGTQARTEIGVRDEDFGPNPAKLRMFKHVPETLPPSPAMVVVLHHCFQTADDYVQETGWQMLSDRYGFLLLMPEQVSGNDPNLCFDWFSANQKRGENQPASIHSMIEKMAADYNVDRKRIFITGLSSGAGMATLMLAVYPEVFAGGGVIGNVPFRCARSFFESFYCMYVSKSREPEEWGDLVRTENSYEGPWPTLSVWHGDLDLIAIYPNAEEIIEQWTNLHGTDAVSDREDTVEGFPHYSYEDASGRVVVEFYSLTDAGHSTPVDPSRGCGDTRQGFADFIHDYGICSSFYMARFWGLTGEDTSWPPSDFVPPAAAGEAETVSGEEEAVPAAEESEEPAMEAVSEEEEAMPVGEEAAPEAEEVGEENEDTMPVQDEVGPEGNEVAPEGGEPPLWTIEIGDAADPPAAEVSANATQEPVDPSPAGAPVELTQ